MTDKAPHGPTRRTMPATRITTWRDEIVESALALYAQRTYEMAQGFHRAGATNLAAYWTECGHTADDLPAHPDAGGES